MKTRAGQAGKIIAESIQQVGRIVLRLCLLLVALLGLLAFTLSRHPLQMPQLASWLATTISGEGITVQMQGAELAWAGYQQGSRMPFVLRLDGIAVHGAAGGLMLEIPEADATVPPVDLFGGRQAILLHAQGAVLPGSTAPVDLSGRLWPGPAYSAARGEFFMTIGAGLVGMGGSSVPVKAAQFLLRTAPGSAEITQGQATLTPIGQSAPHLQFSLTARRAQNWTASLHASLDVVHTDELGRYWPANVLRYTRAWVVKNISAGMARDADFTFSLTAPGDLSLLTLSNVTGHFIGQNLTVRWLPGAVPITGLNGAFTMPDENEALITASTGAVGQVTLRQGSLDITGLNGNQQIGALQTSLAGSVPAVLAVLNAPPLNLLTQGPPGLNHATGEAEGTVTATIPFVVDLGFNQVHLAVAAQVHQLTMPSILPPLGATQGEVSLQTDGHTLTLHAQAQFAGEPAVMTLAESFAGVGHEDLSMSGAAGPQIWSWLGIDTASALYDPPKGIAPFTMHILGTASASQSMTLHADLTPVTLALPALAWGKAAGVPGDFTMAAQLRNGMFIAAQHFAATAPGLAVAGGQHGTILQIDQATIGRTQAAGSITIPHQPSTPWQVALAGPMLDIRQPKQSDAKQSAAAKTADARPPDGPAWTVQLQFPQLYLAPASAPALGHFTFTANGRGPAILQGQGGADGLDMSIAPQSTARRTLSLHAADAGTLLRVLGDYAHLQGGTLTLDAAFGGGQPAAGHATLLNARFANAPDVTKILQALTLYGLADAASGPGLEIARAEIPFSLQDGVLTLQQARAFSSSLGFTASGTLDLATGACDLNTTIVPLYALNALPGRIPLIGQLFSAEKGGGLLAMRARIFGPLDNAQVMFNPLSALTPGFLRGIFGLGEGSPATKN